MELKHIERYLSLSTAKSIYIGSIRKQSRRAKAWRLRRYEIRTDATIVTFDPLSNEPTGLINASILSIQRGDVVNVDKSGSSDFSVSIGVALTLIEESNDPINVVFDSAQEAQDFCVGIARVSKSHDIRVCYTLRQTRNCLIISLLDVGT
jgi:hypothetical protein